MGDTFSLALAATIALTPQWLRNITQGQGSAGIKEVKEIWIALEKVLGDLKRRIRSPGTVMHLKYSSGGHVRGKDGRRGRRYPNRKTTYRRSSVIVRLLKVHIEGQQDTEQVNLPVTTDHVQQGFSVIIASVGG